MKRDTIKRDVPQPVNVALDRYTDPAYEKGISEAMQADFIAFDVPEGATFADGIAIQMAISSATLRDCIADMGGEAIRKTAHALRFANSPFLFLNLPNGWNVLAEAYAKELIAYAQESPGSPLWEGELQIWLVRLKKGNP